MLSFGFGWDEEIEIRIHDLSGKLLRTTQYGDVKENVVQTHELNSDDLSEGIYFAELIANRSGKRYYLKLVLEKF